MIKNAIHKFELKNYNKDTIIGEFSGRDSVAAIMKVLENPNIKYILPIASFSGTEYGNYDQIYDNYEKMVNEINRKYNNEKIIYPLMEYNREDLWHLMNGRFLGVLSQKYEYVTPCIGCHLYFHLIKLNMAKQLSGKIISGERESHDGRIKLNQHKLTLEVFDKIMKSLDIELLSPLRNIENSESIENLIGFEWKEGKDHPACVLSGNYLDKNAKAILDEEKLERYLNEFIVPMGNLVGTQVIEGTQSLEELKEEMLKLI